MTCQEYYNAEKIALQAASAITMPSSSVTPSGCTVLGDAMCGITQCGSALLYYGATYFENSNFGCSCCASDMECGEYNPTAENDLSFAPIYNETMTRNDASLVVSFFDCISSIIFLLMWKYMHGKVKIVIRQTDDDNVTAGDYTVFVTGLPKDALEEDIRKHFSDLYDLSVPDWEFKGYLCGLWGSKKARKPEECIGYDFLPMKCEPVSNVDLHGKQKYLGSWVADVNIARPNGKLIRRCQALKKYSIKLLEARAQVKKHSPGTPLKGGSKVYKLAKSEKKLKAIQDRIAKIHKSLQSSAKSFKRIDNECMAAFITFENEDSYIRCMDDYERYSERSFLKVSCSESRSDETTITNAINATSQSTRSACRSLGPG